MAKAVNMKSINVGPMIANLRTVRALPLQYIWIVNVLFVLRNHFKILRFARMPFTTIKLFTWCTDQAERDHRSNYYYRCDWIECWNHRWGFHVVRIFCLPKVQTIKIFHPRKRYIQHNNIQCCTPYQPPTPQYKYNCNMLNLINSHTDD